MSLVVLDIGVGNTASMVWALERLGAQPVLSADPLRATEAERLVFPGVGAAGHAMERVVSLGLDAVIASFPRPLLGVCLGMQLLFEASDEGDTNGLGLLSGRVTPMEPGPERPVPHMGWNQLRLIRPDEPLLEGVSDGDYAYFVHGYAAGISAATVANTDYGEAFSAVVRKDNLWGCQFHPERSGATGARILKNFLEIPC